MFSSVSKSLSEKIGVRLGFFLGLILFSTLLFFVGLKFRIIPSETSYYMVISLVALSHIVYSVIKMLVKND